VEFGVITQASIAFAQLLGGFSLIVTQFQSISTYTAVVARIDDFSEAAHESDSAPAPPIDVVDGEDGLVIEHLTLESSDDKNVLVEDLSLEVHRGTRLLVIGPGEMARMALFRAMAGLWDSGHGRIVRPSAHCTCFVPERPYLPPGTLQQALTAASCTDAPNVASISDILHTLDLDDMVRRVGGLDVERDWDDVLSLGELQRVAIARVLVIKPDFAVLDRVETTLEPDCFHRVFDLLDAAGTTYVTIGRTDRELQHYDMVLELSGTGPWTLHPAKAANVAV
jgi:putative ATP-binding cassette transporter